MICVSCGWCCKNMSPINNGYCPLLIEEKSPTGTIYLCSDYENRPEECKKHSVPSYVCTIGQESLGIETQSDLVNRMDAIKEAIGKINEDAFCLDDF